MDILRMRNLLSQGKSIYDLPLRVTYYARVSTDREEQVNSLENQIMYFDNLIKKQENWTFVPGYIDEGISGTSVNKRERFLDMIRDANFGKFDLILTKEISRFSRNTLDSIKYTRELLECGVGVHFLSDNINTFLPDSELRLTIMSSMAQEEVRKLSERVRFGYQRSVEKGVVAGSNNIYGYRKDNGKLVIDEEQAEIVRKIFELYVYEGIGTTKLSFLLYNEYGFTNSRGNPIHPANIRDIIRNPKYKGYYCANKGISLDFRTKKRKFYSKDKWIVYKDNENVPPIVSEELWEKANEILDSRGNKHSSEDKSVYVKRYPLSGKIYCAHDNSLYVRGNYKLKSGKKVYWACDNYRRNGIAKSSGCKSPLLYEEELKNVFKPIIQRIINEKEEIIEEIKDILNEAKLQGSYIKEKEKYANDIKQYERQKDELFDMRSKQEITPKEFIEFKNKLDIKIDETKKAIDKIIAIEENINSSCESVETLKRNIESVILDDDNSVFEIASSLFEKIYVEVDRDSESCRKAVMHIQLKIEEMQRENLSLSQLSMLLRGDTRVCSAKWKKFSLYTCFY